MDEPKPQPQNDALAEYQHLLPPGLAQHKTVTIPPRKDASRTGGAIGIGAVLVALLVKFKTVLLVLLNFKWVAIGLKILLSSGTMLASIWAWSLLYGWSFATGFVLLILVHELGHVAALRAYGMKSSLPMFIPFIGAFVAHKEQAPSPKASAFISLAGPAVGGLGALACFITGMYTGSPYWFALASLAFVINLFNLLPIGPLDGGHIAGALHSMNDPAMSAQRAQVLWSTIAVAAVLFVLWLAAGHALAATPR
jgi:Zn-dependent protease